MNTIRFDDPLTNNHPQTTYLYASNDEGGCILLQRELHGEGSHAYLHNDGMGVYNDNVKSNFI